MLFLLFKIHNSQENNKEISWNNLKTNHWTNFYVNKSSSGIQRLNWKILVANRKMFIFLLKNTIPI
jgi:hypothetical protein